MKYLKGIFETKKKQNSSLENLSLIPEILGDLGAKIIKRSDDSYEIYKYYKSQCDQKIGEIQSKLGEDFSEYMPQMELVIREGWARKENRNVISICDYDSDECHYIFGEWDNSQHTKIYKAIEKNFPKCNNWINSLSDFLDSNDMIDW